MMTKVISSVIMERFEVIYLPCRTAAIWCTPCFGFMQEMCRFACNSRDLKLFNKHDNWLEYPIHYDIVLLSRIMCQTVPRACSWAFWLTQSRSIEKAVIQMSRDKVWSWSHLCWWINSWFENVPTLLMLTGWMTCIVEGNQRGWVCLKQTCHPSSHLLVRPKIMVWFNLVHLLFWYGWAG